MRCAAFAGVLALGIVTSGPAPGAPFRYVDRRGHSVLVDADATAVEGDDASAGTDGDAYPYAAEIAAASAETDLPIALIRAVIAVESNGQSRALSRKGARGLMQLMPSTAEELGVEAPFDPRENIFGGARYLRRLLEDFGWDLPLALASYNAGRGAVERAGRSAPSRETRRYVARVLAYYQRFVLEERP